MSWLVRARWSIGIGLSLNCFGSYSVIGLFKLLCDPSVDASDLCGQTDEDEFVADGVGPAFGFSELVVEQLSGVCGDCFVVACMEHQHRGVFHFGRGVVCVEL